MKLKSLLKESLLNELEFGTQKAFDSYQKQHDLRGDTEVTVAGKKMSVKQAVKQSKDSELKGSPVFGNDKGGEVFGKKSDDTENEEDTTKKTIEHLMKLASTGKLDNQAIDDIAAQLKSARRKMFTSKITPDQRKAAAAKAKATREKSKADMEKFMKKVATSDANRKAAEKRRKDNNLLPLSVDDYSMRPDKKYYDYDYQDRGGLNVYKLKDRYRTTPVSPETAKKHWGNDED